MFLHSEDSLDANPNNSYSDFTVILPTVLQLADCDSAGMKIHWTVALCEVHLQSGIDSDTSHTIALMTDIVEQSYLNGGYAPVLRIFPADSIESSSLYTPYYIALAQNTFASIRIYLQPIKRNAPPLNRSSRATLSCCLHFQPNHH